MRKQDKEALLEVLRGLRFAGKSVGRFRFLRIQVSGTGRARKVGVVGSSVSSEELALCQDVLQPSTSGVLVLSVPAELTPVNGGFIREEEHDD